MSERDDLDKLTEALNAAGRAERPSAAKKEAILEAVLAKARGPGGGSRGGRRPVLWLSAIALSLAVGTWWVKARAAPAPRLPSEVPAADVRQPAVAHPGLDVSNDAPAAPVQPATNEADGGALAAKAASGEPLVLPPAAPRRTVVEDDDALAREVRLLDQARASVEKEPARTLTLLEKHRREFPAGALVVEAELVRIEAYLKSGRRVDAERIAERLIATSPDGPVAARARRLLGEAP
ncbi:MAG: hypothetical protein JNJ54_15470 [Myxococcaceae bacterium]|nr:hypothetical protein [Myxococcaceae bacterium]